MNVFFVTLVKEILNNIVCLSGFIVYVLQFHVLLFFTTPLFLSSSQQHLLGLSTCPRAKLAKYSVITLQVITYWVGRNINNFIAAYFLGSRTREPFNLSYSPTAEENAILVTCGLRPAAHLQ